MPSDKLLEEIKTMVHNAEKEKKKVAMLHYQILIHANELEGMKPKEFCETIDVPESYATEFKKMLNLAKLMKEFGSKIIF